MLILSILCSFIIITDIEHSLMINIANYMINIDYIY